MSTSAPANIATRLADLAARHPERVAIVSSCRGRSQRLTFGDLLDRVFGFAAALERTGIRAGDRVLLLAPISADLYVALLSCFYLGAAAVFVDAWAGWQRLDAAVAVARPKVFLGTWKAHLLRCRSAAIRRIPFHLVVGSGLGVYPRPGAAARSAAAFSPALVDPGEAALVTLTTGSTGRPKAAARSHASLWAQHRALAAVLGTRETDVDMPALPVLVLNNLAAGIPSVLPQFDPRRPGEIDPPAIYRQILAEGVTTATGSPAFLERLAGWCRGTGRRLPLRAVFTGGAPVTPPLARLLASTVDGCVRVVYGSTEAEPIAAIDVGELLALSAPAAGPECARGLCAGRPVETIRVRLVRPQDAPISLADGGWGRWEVPAGEVGEVLVAGPHVLGTYLDDPEADCENKVRDSEHTWHRTGDAARFDGEGRLWLMGRVGERIRRAGETWWPLPAELRAVEVPGVTHAACLGVPDPRLGARVVLCVEHGGGRLSSEEERKLRASLSPMPIDALRVFRRIPRDSRHASKADTEALRRRLRRRHWCRPESQQP